MDFLIFNATLWLGVFAIIGLLAAVVSNPIPAICAGLFLVGLITLFFWTYGKSWEVFAKQDDLFMTKEGEYVFKGNGHRACLKEYAREFWWTYDLDDKKFIKPTIHEQRCYDSHELNVHYIKDYKTLMEANGYVKGGWKKYNEYREFYDRQHEEDIFTSWRDVNSIDEMRSKCGFRNVDDIFDGLEDCIMFPILNGNSKRYTQTEVLEKIQKGRTKIENAINRYRRMKAENETYTGEIPIL